MKIDRFLNVENIAKSREDISKKKIIELYGFLTETTEKFFGEKSSTNITVYRSYLDSVVYDSLEEFQKNFANSVEFDSVHLSSSPKLSERISLNIRYDEPYNKKKLPVSIYISVSCENKTEVEVDDLLQEIKSYITDFFSLHEEGVNYSAANNNQPTDHSDEKFWIKHKPLLDFLYLVLGIVISVATIIGLFKSCNGDTVNNEIKENQTLHSQQNEITSVADKTTLLS